MKAPAPKISVLIPVFNGERCLGRAIDSVLSQTYKDLELVLVDDGSTDDSALLIAHYRNRFPRNIRYFFKQNEGPGKTLEYAATLARGEFLAFLDQDDYWYEDKLERQIREFQNDPDLVLVCSDWCRGEALSDGRESVLQLLMEHSDKEPFERLLLENPIRPSSVLVKKSVILDVGFADIGVSYGPWDRPLWIKIAHKHKIKLMNDILVWTYEHESTLSHRPNYCELQHLYWEHLRSYFSDLPNKYKRIIKRNCAETLANTATYYLSKNDFDRYKVIMRKAIARYPCYTLSNYTLWGYLALLILPKNSLGRVRKFRKVLRNVFLSRRGFRHQ